MSMSKCLAVPAGVLLGLFASSGTVIAGDGDLQRALREASCTASAVHELTGHASVTVYDVRCTSGRQVTVQCSTVGCTIQSLKNSND